MPETKECTCGNLVNCVCGIQERHDEDCRFRRAAELSVQLACKHGFQACVICDPCDCDADVEEKSIR